MIKRALLLLAITGLCSPCWSQAYHDHGAIGWGVYGDAGKMGGAGGYLGIYKTGPWRQVLNSGAFADLGVLGLGRLGNLEGVVSLNYQTTYNLRRDREMQWYNGEFLYLTGGYSRLSQTGNGANYGVGYLMRGRGNDSGHSGLRVEYRETYVPGWGRRPGVRLAFEWGGEL